MKKLNKLSETDFLKLFFLFLSTCFLVGAVCMPDRGEMLSGLGNILASTCKISTNYFAVGGFAATFLNMALLGFVLTGLYHFLKAPVNNVSTLAFVLTLGFGSWGINVLNMWFSVLGVVLYAAKGLFTYGSWGHFFIAIALCGAVGYVLAFFLLFNPGEYKEIVHMFLSKMKKKTA